MGLNKTEEFVDLELDLDEDLDLNLYDDIEIDDIDISNLVLDISPEVNNSFKESKSDREKTLMRDILLRNLNYSQVDNVEVQIQETNINKYINSLRKTINENLNSATTLKSDEKLFNEYLKKIPVAMSKLKSAIDKQLENKDKLSTNYIGKKIETVEQYKLIEESIYDLKDINEFREFMESIGFPIELFTEISGFESVLLNDIGNIYSAMIDKRQKESSISGETLRKDYEVYESTTCIKPLKHMLYDLRTQKQIIECSSCGNHEEFQMIECTKTCGSLYLNIQRNKYMFGLHLYKCSKCGTVSCISEDTMRLLDNELHNQLINIVKDGVSMKSRNKNASTALVPTRKMLEDKRVENIDVVGNVEFFKDKSNFLENIDSFSESFNENFRLKKNSIRFKELKEVFSTTKLPNTNYSKLCKENVLKICNSNYKNIEELAISFLFGTNLFSRLDHLYNEILKMEEYQIVFEKILLELELLKNDNGDKKINASLSINFLNSMIKEYLVSGFEEIKSDNYLKIVKKYIRLFKDSINILEESIATNKSMIQSGLSFFKEYPLAIIFPNSKQVDANVNDLKKLCCNELEFEEILSKTVDSLTQAIWSKQSIDEICDIFEEKRLIGKHAKESIDLLKVCGTYNLTEPEIRGISYESDILKSAIRDNLSNVKYLNFCNTKNSKMKEFRLLRYVLQIFEEGLDSVDELDIFNKKVREVVKSINSDYKKIYLETRSDKDPTLFEKAAILVYNGFKAEDIIDYIKDKNNKQHLIEWGGRLGKKKTSVKIDGYLKSTNEVDINQKPNIGKLYELYNWFDLLNPLSLLDNIYPEYSKLKGILREPVIATSFEILNNLENSINMLQVYRATDNYYCWSKLSNDLNIGKLLKDGLIKIKSSIDLTEFIDSSVQEENESELLKQKYIEEYLLLDSKDILLRDKRIILAFLFEVGEDLIQNKIDINDNIGYDIIESHVETIYIDKCKKLYTVANKRLENWKILNELNLTLTDVVKEYNSEFIALMNHLKSSDNSNNFRVIEKLFLGTVFNWE